MLSKAGQEQPNMISQKFGQWLVLSYDKEISKQNGRDSYFCRCDCDTERVVKGNSLRQGNSQNCGCLRLKRNKERWRELGKRNKIGENNPNYLFGYHTKAREKFRESIRRRDNYKCQRCGKTQEKEMADMGKKLHIHHKDGDHYNDVSENATTFCQRCHRIVEGER